MSNQTFDDAQMNPAVRYLNEQYEASLAESTEELAGLRFSIVLTAKWESSESLSTRRRDELWSELCELRSLYLAKVDEIAMSFGVQQAVEAKEAIERTVAVPDDMEPWVMPIESEGLFS